MTKKNARVALTLVLVGSAHLAFAQSAGNYIRPTYQYPDVPPVSGPASVQVGESPLYFTPYLGAAVGHDSNLFLSNVNRKDSNMYVGSGGVALDARDSNKVFKASFQSQYGVYTSSREDDYWDNLVHTSLDVAIDRRNFVRVGYDYIRSHDPRGSTDRPFSTSPDKFQLSDPFFTYALGAPGAAGRVEAYYTDGIKRYLNNREFTAASDRDTQEYGAAFYWRVMPRTYLLLEGRETNIRYKISNSPLNADERRIYAGVTWEATAATTGTIKYGSLKREFTNDSFPDFSGGSWEGLISWAPRTYSKFDFYTARQTNESTGLGSFILSTIGGATWTHAWSSFVTTGVDLRYQKDAYQGFDRTDKTWIAGLHAGYKFRRWLTIGAEYTHYKRDSNIDSFDYDRNLFLLTATASM